jgi:3-oxoacyl-[acyl-carrier-protein] synthase-3
VTKEAALGIKGISSYIPAQRLDNYARAETMGKVRSFVDDRIGITSLPRRADDEDTSDLASAAVQALLASEPELAPERVGALVVVTQNPDGRGLPHVSAITQRKVGLPQTTAAFDVSLGCSGYVYGLYVLAGFMSAVGIGNGVLVTADPYSKILDGTNPATDLLFGDAATATWIGPDPTWRLGAARFGTDGGGAEHLVNQDGLLHMNGRRVMEFAKNRVPDEITALLAEEGLTQEEVDRYLMHQGSRAVVDVIARQFGDLAGRYPWAAHQTGNTVSSTLPFLLMQAQDDPAVRTVVVCGFGVGFSWGSAVLHRTRSS